MSVWLAQRSHSLCTYAGCEEEQHSFDLREGLFDSKVKQFVPALVVDRFRSIAANVITITGAF